MTDATPHLDESEAPMWVATFRSGDATWTQTFPATDREAALDCADAFCYERHTRYTVKRVEQ